MKKKAIIVGMMLVMSMVLLFAPNVSANSTHTELELTNYIDCQLGETVTVSLYVIPQDDTWIDTVATDEITFTTSKLDFVGDGVSWGNLFTSTIFQIDGTVDESGGKVTDIVWGAENVSSPGYVWNITFDTVSIGYAYVNLTFADVGIALDGSDMPKIINSNTTIFIHQYIPNSPTSFSADGASSSTIDLTWISDSGADTTYIESWETLGPHSRGTGSLVYNSTGNSHTDDSLDPHKTYYYQAWSYNATDNEFSDTYSDDSGTTFNTAPDVPTIEVPTNDSDYVSVYQEYMNITISDADSDTMNVSFYWDNGTLIHTLTELTDGVASILLQNYIFGNQLIHDTYYLWYVSVTDGYDTTNTTTFIFHTSKSPDINEDRVVNYLDVSALVTHYGEAVSPPGSDGWDINNDGDTDYLDVSALVTAYGDNY